MGYIDIWQPRWKDRVALIAKFRVAQDNYIRFTKTKSLPGVYYISKEKLEHYPIQFNGGCDCYVVPLKDLYKIPENKEIHEQETLL